MNGKEFYNLFQAKWNEANRDNTISKVDAEAYCRTMLAVLDEQFDTMPVGDKVVIYGFGSFVKKETAARPVGDFVNGGTRIIPAKEKIVFKRSEY